jgi:hypothetical protein
MSTPIMIWSAFSAIEILAAITNSEEKLKPVIATCVFLLTSAVLISTGHIFLFAALNFLPALFLFVLGGFDLLVAPPGTDTDRAQTYIASGIIRLAFIAACCYTS